MFDEPIVRETLSVQVYHRLRLSLFQNEYKPGQQLDIRQIAADFNVSRQPVKEAIARLSQEGLVEIRQRVGSFVRRFNREDIRKIMEARRLIETFALANATVTDASLVAMEKELEHMDQTNETSPTGYLTFNDSDYNFHRLLVELSGNNILLRMYVQLNAHYVAARTFYTYIPERSTTGYGQEYYKAQHRRIVEHLKQGEMKQAIDALDAHIKESENELLTICKE